MRFRSGYKLLFLLLLSFVVGLSNPLIADAAEKKDKAARKAALLMQKMKQDTEVEKAAMQTQFDTQKKVLEDRLKAVEDDLTKSNKQFEVSERKVKSLSSELAKTKNEKLVLDSKLAQTQTTLESTQKNLTDTTAQLKQANTDLKFNDNQRKTLASNLSDTTKAVNSCETKNKQLHQFGSDLVKLYDNPSTYEAAMRKEKFFQLKRVELENILQAMQDSLDESKFSRNK